MYSSDHEEEWLLFWHTTHIASVFPVGSPGAQDKMRKHSAVECLSSMLKVLGLIPTTGKRWIFQWEKWAQDSCFFPVFTRGLPSVNVYWSVSNNWPLQTFTRKWMEFEDNRTRYKKWSLSACDMSVPTWGKAWGRQRATESCVYMPPVFLASPLAQSER